jgi:hypothetical protein
MDKSTACGRLSAIADVATPGALTERLLPVIREMFQLIEGFRSSEVTPQATFGFEDALNGVLRKLGRAIVEWVYNDLEPSDPDSVPTGLPFGGEYYRRRRQKRANRHVGTLFGTITLTRFLYQPLTTGEPSIFPLEICLGLEAGKATPALADRVAGYSANCTQQTVLEMLRRDHEIGWSAKSLRGVTACVSRAMAEHRHAAQVAKVIGWLKKAHASRGSRKPVLSVGRDGIFLPMRNESCYREGAVATLAVLDRRGRRLGTVYLGRMPEPEQTTLSNQLTALISDVLAGWSGPLPRLAYVTDAGHHPTEYFHNVLARMPNPHRPDEYLFWEWVVDYYHACQYISKPAEALFGVGRESQAWSAKMRKWLKNKRGGVNRLLHSAAAVRQRRGLVGSKSDYEKAYNYLRKHMSSMDYVAYRAQHLPIGSGVTEAACKTVFTQRLKQSGMSWGVEGGQVITDLRVILLSGIWSDVRRAHLSSKILPCMPTQPEINETCLKMAA